MKLDGSSNTVHTKNPSKKDVYKDTPIRFLGFTNELGTAAHEVCASSTGLMKHILPISYVPALCYIGADVFDKYKKGEDGTGEKPSVKMGTRELVAQGLTSVLAPTGVVLATQKAFKKGVEVIGPKMPKGAKEFGGKIINKLQENKVTGKIFNTKGRMTQLAAVAVSLVALIVATKPIDKVADKFIEKVIDPLIGIKKNKQTKTEKIEENKETETSKNTESIKKTKNKENSLDKKAQKKPPKFLEGKM